MFFEIESVKSLLHNFPAPYWIAGGWAVDLFLGHQTRPHRDIEIAMDRKDQQALRNLKGITHIEYVQNGIKEIWAGGFLNLPVHELHCYLNTGKTVEVLLNEFDAVHWFYRRNRAIKRGREVFPSTPGGAMPIEIVLLYKSGDMREVDQQDFNAAHLLLTPDQKDWLYNAISIQDMSHSWLRRMAKTQEA